MKRFLTILVFLLIPLIIKAQILEVKQGRSAIVKVDPTGEAEQFPDRLPSGTRVRQMGEVDRYYDILLNDGSRGWSYKGNFIVISEDDTTANNVTNVVTEQSLMSRSDVLKIIIVDVEVGDATIIICPAEDGERNVLVIDTGVDDGDRIKNILVDNGIGISVKTVDRLYITHYDKDHFGDAEEMIPISEIIYDHGSNNLEGADEYILAVNQPNVDRRTMTLDYFETFSGGVDVECVAVNQATDFDPSTSPSTSGDNPNSIALIISYNGFDYFTGGDLTFKPEKSLATGIRNCDVYHEDHHGSKATSSDSTFLVKLDPEVSIASNGTKYGHPSAAVAQRLISLGSMHLQTNLNEDPRAYQKDLKYIADDTYFDENELEEEEGALGNITVVVDAVNDSYYIIMPGLPLSEATFPIEHN